MGIFHAFNRFLVANGYYLSQPGIYQTQDFHHCGLESGDDIVDYSNRLEVQTCELVNLAEYVPSHFSGAL